MIVQANTSEAKTVKVFGGEISIRFLAVKDDTRGHYSLYEIICEPGSGPPLHVHSDVDEAFYVVEGSFQFQIGEDRFLASSGWFGYGRRGIQHAFIACGSTPARLLVTVSPAGLEDFFVQLSEATSGNAADPPAVTEVFEKYGMQIVGPQLQIDQQLA